MLLSSGWRSRVQSVSVDLFVNTIGGGCEAIVVVALLDIIFS